MHESSDRLTYLKLTAVTMIWGGTFVAGRYLAGGVDPLLAASLRFILASLALLVFLGVSRTPLVRPSAAQMARLTVLGFLGSFSTTCVFFTVCSLSTRLGQR